jgi:hypothetical protein
MIQLYITMAVEADAMAIMVANAIKFEILLFTLSPRIFLSFAIFIIIIKSGTDIIPFITAA